MDAVRRAWLAAELEQTSLRYETFGNSGWFEPEAFTVEVPRLGVQTSVRPDESLLDALERAGVETMFSCKKGECGICQIKVLNLEGEIDHRDVFHSEEEKVANTRM
jgi:vanillate O-demethylase ferredoxin subunit